MPRPKRLNIPGIPQHLVQRGNNRQSCFRDAADYRLYLELLNIACKRHSCDVHAYVLMTNHVHILMTPGEPDGASLVFRDLGRDYVRQFNRRHGRTGTLWEGRLESSLVDTENYLLAWETLEERGTIGFYAERQADDKSWKRLNNDMLPSMIVAPMGAEYLLFDPEAGQLPEYLYRLIEVEAWGTKVLHGPWLFRLKQ